MDPTPLRPDPPPVLDRTDAGLATAALPLLGGLGSLGFVATLAAGPRQYAALAALLGATVLATLAQVDRQHRARVTALDTGRRDYLAHLAGVRLRVRALAAEQRYAALRRHPPPDALAALAAVGAPPDADGADVRYGTIDGPLAVGLEAPAVAARADPVCAEAVRRLVAVQATVPGLPATLDLTATSEVTASAPTARALVCAAATGAGPAVAVLAGPRHRDRWEWVRWLPRAVSPVARDAVGAARLVAGTPDELLPLLPATGRLLLVVDGVPPPRWERPVTVLRVAEDAAAVTADGRVLPGVPDGCSVAAAEAFARRSGTVRAGPSPEPDWSPRPGTDRLRVAIGRADDGTDVVLDLKEAAAGGAGPHGMVIGATGSGKSELLRTLVLRLALTHPPDELRLVLVDFKGAAAFDGLADLPHVDALLTNLAEEVDLLDRAADALHGELVRRQRLLRDAGGGGTRLPTLLVVVDEYAELLAARPELDDLFVTLGRLGRGLGVHLLLASQRLDEGRWRGLDAHLSYRIGLRTFTAEESRAVLGVADAHTLPPLPGLGLLRVGPGTPVRFRADYAGDPAPASADPRRVLPFTTARVGALAPAAATTVLETAVSRMRGAGSPAHRIWLPPLDRPATLGSLLARRAVPDGDPGRRPPTVPLGEVDLPREQRRRLLELDPTAGHVAVVGAPGSGRSTLLRTAVAGLALTRAPDEVAVHLVDGGGALAPLAGLPHVAGHAGPGEHDVAARLVDRLADRLVDRLAAGSERPTVLVVDGWSALRRQAPDLEDALVAAAGAGVHLLLAADRWSDLRATLRDLLGTRLELRLGDPLDSEVDRRLAAAVPRDRPGRGLVDGAHFLAALPRLGGPGPDAEKTDDTALADLVRHVRAAWPGEPSVPTRRYTALPRQVALADLPGSPHLRLGLAEGDPAPAVLPDGAHLVVLGDPGSGRTTLLRTLVHEVVRTRAADRARVLLLDPRGTSAGEVPPAHLVAHVRGDPTAPVAELAEHLGRRLAGTVRGPELWLVVDDLDLLPGTGWDRPLLPYVARAAGLGLRLALARRTGGAARAIHEPLLATLREAGATGLLLPGDPAEGVLLGNARPRPGPPGRAWRTGPPGPGGPIQVAWTTPRLGSIKSAKVT